MPSDLYVQKSSNFLPPEELSRWQNQLDKTESDLPIFCKVRVCDVDHKPSAAAWRSGISLNFIVTCQATSMNSTKQIELRKIQCFVAVICGYLRHVIHVVPRRCMVCIIWYQRISPAMIVYIPHSMLERLCWIDSRWAGIPVKWAKVHGYQCESNWIQRNHTWYLILCSCFTKLGKLFHSKYIRNHYKHQTSTCASWKPPWSPWPDMNFDQLSLHKFAQFLLSVASESQTRCWQNVEVRHWPDLQSFIAKIRKSPHWYHLHVIFWPPIIVKPETFQVYMVPVVLFNPLIHFVSDHLYTFLALERAWTFCNPSKWVPNRNSKCGLWPKREAGQTCKEIPIQMLQNWWNRKQSELHTVEKHTRMADGLYLTRFHQCLWTSLNDLMWGMPTCLDPRSKWLPHCWSMKCLWGARWWPSGKKRRTKFDRLEAAKLHFRHSGWAFASKGGCGWMIWAKSLQFE